MKSSEVSIETRSTPASLSFKGQATKHTTVKWSIVTDAQNGNEALGNVKSQEGLSLAMTYYKLAKDKGGHQAVSTYQDLG